VALDSAGAINITKTRSGPNCTAAFQIGGTGELAFDEAKRARLKAAALGIAIKHDSCAHNIRRDLIPKTFVKQIATGSYLLLT
jgi:hypothetical protein